MKHLLIATAAVLALAGCGEKPQTSAGVKSDKAPHTGTGKNFAEAGWKQGDRGSWEQQLKTRTVNGQNADYVRAQ